MHRNPTCSASAVLVTCAALAAAVSGQPACGEWTQHLVPNADAQHNLLRGVTVNSIDVLASLNAWNLGC